MPANLTSADVVVTLSQRDIIDTPNGRLTYPTITFGAGDASLTYPAGGIPLPSMAYFGFKKSIRAGGIFGDDSALGYIYKYDRTNHKLLIYQSAATATTFGVLATNAAVVVTTLTLEFWGN